MKKRTITVIKNGPLELNNIDKLYTAEGNIIEISNGTTLCRCGQSMEMPFCDGMHSIFGFNDKRDSNSPQEEATPYFGEKITVYFNSSVCSHRGLCFEKLPMVFQMNTKEGAIHPDAADIEKIIQICRECPSGALSFALKNQERTCVIEGDESKVAISKRRYGYDGPLEVSGDITLIDEDGSIPECSNHYVLCRCGHSTTMPFCSGDHWRYKFLDDSNDESHPHDPLGIDKNKIEL